MPPKSHVVCRRPGREPQREDADGDAAEVSQEMCCVRHDGQTAGSVSTCKEGNNNPSILLMKLENLIFFFLVGTDKIIAEFKK